MPGLKSDPPKIFYSTTPAVLVNFDGDPIWNAITKNDLTFAVNTNWDVFQHEPTKTFYLRYNDSWLTATAVTGPWTAAGKLPPSFSSLPADENFAEVRKAVPGKSLSASQRPAVNVSMVPAELILLRGAASYLAVAGTKDLLWVSNTESDVFRLGKAGPIYYLVAGRWFSAPDFTGPWTFATPTLPDDFKKIPLEHERSRVLASVPGTDEAIEAVLLAQIPQTARVDRTKIEAPPANYNGAPEFAPIPGTSLQRAVNTDKDIIQFGADFYYCNQGVWFIGKSANGPWQVASTIPAEIYKIPASSPSHHVTYVVVEEDDNDNDDWITFAYVGRLHGADDRLGLCGVGQRVVLPAVCVRRDLLPALRRLRVFGSLQPVDRFVRTQRRGVRAVRWCRCERTLQPADRHLLSRRGRVGTVRRQGRRLGLQSADRRGRHDPAGLQRLWQLGIDRRSTRR